MNNPYVNSDGRAESLNQTAAHDPALYDPAVHDNQIVAVYETDADANAARDALLGAGIPQAAIQVVDKTYGDAAGPSSAEDRNQGGFLGTLKSLFVPSEDVSTGYGEAIVRGHAMLILTPDATMDRQRAIQVLEESNPIDFDAKLEEWRQAGYEQMPQAGAAQPPAADTGNRPPPLDTGYRTGWRETMPGASRVRSYVTDRSGFGSEGAGAVPSRT